MFWKDRCDPSQIRGRGGEKNARDEVGSVRALWIIAPVVRQFASGKDPEQAILACPRASARLRTAVAVLEWKQCGNENVFWDPGETGAGGEWPSVMDYWDVDEVVCYDPCYPPFSKYPGGKFDGVISTDVLEHCPEEDIPWIIDEIFSFATRFVFANVACYPARKRLPTGENAHCTIQPVEWWKHLIEGIAASYPGVTWEVWIQSRVDGPQGSRLVEQRIGNT